MMVALLSEGRHPGFYLRELGICAVCSMSTSTTREGKGEPCVGKHTNSTAMNGSTKALQIVKYLEGTPDGNPDLFMRKGRDSYGPSGTTTKTYEGGNLVGSAMDRTENQESPASPARVGAAADRIRELKPNADEKYRKIIDIITDPHALIAAYQRIKSKLRKKEGMTNERSSREEINFLSALIGDGSSTSQNNCARGNTPRNK
jgi:hypothetical protein